MLLELDQGSLLSTSWQPHQNMSAQALAPTSSLVQLLMARRRQLPL